MHSSANDVYVVDFMLILRAMLDEDGPEADVIRHLQSSPVEAIAVAEQTIQEVLATSTGGIAVSAVSSTGVATHRIRAHHVASWISAHAPLFGSVVPRPQAMSNSRAALAGVHGGLVDPILTASAINAVAVVTPLPIGPALRARPLGIEVISPMEFYDRLEA